MAPMQSKVALMQMMKQDARDYNFKFAQQRAYLKGRAAQEHWQEDKKQISRHFNAWITRWDKRV
jgi:hypothetical protein